MSRTQHDKSWYLRTVQALVKTNDELTKQLHDLHGVVTQDEFAERKAQTNQAKIIEAKIIEAKIIKDWKAKYPVLTKTWITRDELLAHQTKVIEYYEDKIAELYAKTHVLLLDARKGSKLYTHGWILSRFLITVKQNRPLPASKEQ